MSTVYFLALFQVKAARMTAKNDDSVVGARFGKFTFTKQARAQNIFILFSDFNSQSETPASLNSYGKAPSLPSSVSGGTLYFQMMNLVV